MNQDYIKAVTQLGRPIPGQSLTNDPDNPAPYERAPEYTSVHSASEFIFEKLIDEEVYPQIMGLLADDVPIMDVVRTTLFAGFTEGKWNPDLMLMLVEPVAYMLLALAERAEIDPIIYRGEDEDEDEEERVLGTKYEKEKLKSMKKVLSSRSVPSNVISPEILQQIEQMPVPSLMTPEQPEQTTPETAGSLLSAPASAPTEEEMQ